MASVYKTPKSKIWTCSFKSSNGKYTQVSTKQTDEAKARLFCDSLQKVADDYREKVRTVSYLKKMLNSIAALVGGETIEDYTFRTWSDAWLADQEAANAEGTYKRYKQLFDEFKTRLGKKADAPLSELTSEDIRLFRDQAVKEGMGAASANVLLKAIRACLNLAVKQGHLAYNRGEAVKLLSRLPTIKKPFARAQVEQLLSQTEGEWRGLILAGYFIGARLGSLAKLQREQVNYETEVLTYTPNKQLRSADPKALAIPVHQQLGVATFALGSRQYMLHLMDQVAFLFAPGAGARSKSTSMQRWANMLRALGTVTLLDYDYIKAGRKTPDRLPKTCRRSPQRYQYLCFSKGRTMKDDRGPTSNVIVHCAAPPEPFGQCARTAHILA